MLERLPMKYNPALLSEQELVAGFVAREADLRLIMSTLRENTGGPNQHMLVIGPRGSGKTSLLLRAAAQVRRDPELNAAWYPLRFPEESYLVASPGEFWLEALLHLADQTGSSHWKDTFESLREESDEERLRERALGQLLDFAEQEGKRLLLIVENLHMLLGEQISSDDAWKVRHTLINEERIMLLCSATTRFDEIDNADKAMFDLFRILSLPPLTPGECDAVWQSITGQPLGEKGIRPIHILTGGNLRLLTIIAGFGAHRSFADLLHNLIALMDEHTEYFKSHLDGLAPTERKVYLALADLWDESPAREVARVARLDVNKTSALLQRLASRGAVTVVETGKRAKLYAVAERMYNIYHLMRRRGKAADRVNFAVRFMMALYGPEEAARHLALEAEHLAPEQYGDHLPAFRAIMTSIREPEQRDKLLAIAPEHFRNALAKEYLAIPLHKALPIPWPETPEEQLAACANLITLLGGSTQPSHMNFSATALLYKGLTHGQLGNVAEALDVYDTLIGRYGESDEPTLMQAAARALLYKGMAHGAKNDNEEELRAYATLISRYGDSDKPSLMAVVANALLYQGMAYGKTGNLAEELKSYYTLVNRYGDSADPSLMEAAAKALFTKGIRLDRMGRHEEALAAYEALISRYGESREPSVMERAAKALFNTALAHGRAGNTGEEIRAYDSLVARYGDRDEPPVVERVMTALFNKGVALGRLGRIRDEIATYDALLLRYGDSGDPQVTEGAAKALFNKGLAWAQIGNMEEELKAYDDLINRYGGSAEPPVMEQTAKALFNKGVAAGLLGRPAEALEAYDSLIDRYHSSDVPQLQERVAKALLNKGVELGRQGKAEEALAVYDVLISRYGGSGDRFGMERVAKALLNKGVEFGHQGKMEAALEAYDILIGRYGDSAEPAVMEGVAKALLNKATALGHLGKVEEALKEYDFLISRYDRSDAPPVMEAVVKALLNKATALGHLGNTEEALKEYDSLISRYGESRALPVMEGVATALYSKGALLEKSGKIEAALSMYDALIDRYGNSNEPALTAWAAKALLYKGVTAGQWGRREEELAAYDAIISRYKGSEHPAVMKRAAGALFNKGMRLGQAGDTEGEAAAYDSLIARYGSYEEPALRKMVARATAGMALLAAKDPSERKAGLREALRLYPASERLIADCTALLLEEGRPEELAVLAAELLTQSPAKPEPHNALGRAVYRHRVRALYKRAEDWARRAVELAPANTAFRHTLACLQCLLGKGEEALATAAVYLEDAERVSGNLEDAIELVTVLAAAGKAEQALALLEESAAAPRLEPLIIALRLYLERPVTAARELREVAADVVLRIEERARELQTLSGDLPKPS